MTDTGQTVPDTRGHVMRSIELGAALSEYPQPRIFVPPDKTCDHIMRSIVAMLWCELRYASR